MKKKEGPEGALRLASLLPLLPCRGFSRRGGTLFSFKMRFSGSGGEASEHGAPRIKGPDLSHHLRGKQRTRKFTFLEKPPPLCFPYLGANCGDIFPRPRKRTKKKPKLTHFVSSSPSLFKTGSLVFQLFLLTLPLSCAVPAHQKERNHNAKRRRRQFGCNSFSSFGSSFFRSSNALGGDSTAAHDELQVQRAELVPAQAQHGASVSIGGIGRGSGGECEAAIGPLRKCFICRRNKKVLSSSSLPSLSLY